MAVSRPVRSLKWWAGAAWETAGPACQVAQAQRARPIGADDVECGGEDGPPQVAVVVGALAGHGQEITRNLGVDKFENERHSGLDI